VTRAGNHGPLFLLRTSGFSTPIPRSKYCRLSQAARSCSSVKGNDRASRSSIDMAEEGEVVAAESQNLAAPELLEAWPIRRKRLLSRAHDKRSLVEIKGNTLVHAPITYDSLTSRIRNPTTHHWTLTTEPRYPVSHQSTHVI
jgi:hypothetical protein